MLSSSSSACSTRMVHTWGRSVPFPPLLSPILYISVLLMQSCKHIQRKLFFFFFFFKNQKEKEDSSVFKRKKKKKIRGMLFLMKIIFHLRTQWTCNYWFLYMGLIMISHPLHLLYGIDEVKMFTSEIHDPCARMTGA